MKNKRRVFIIVILAALGGLYLVARVTGALQTFTIPSGASQPAINVGDRIWVSNLVSPKRFDHIVFRYYDSMTARKEYAVYRLCGTPGDTVEIRNGDLFVNNENTSGMFDLCLPYLAAADDGVRVDQVLKLDENEFSVTDNGVEMILSKDQVEQIRKLKISVERKIIPKEERDEYISRLYGHSWNNDQFGPLIIPTDRFFVLGNNRHRAMDSRYIGLVPISDFYGTVISK